MAKDVFGLVGTTIDSRYRVDAVIGEGGFGVVYRGNHVAFKRPVAVKCLKVPNHFTSEGQALFLEKFREEGAFLSRLSHPSIVRVFDFSVVDTPKAAQVPYLILEWLEGRELEAIIDERRCRGQGSWSEEEAIALLRPAIDALAVVHAQKIAHRDLKPANLFEQNTPEGTVLKVLDFGIAKAMQEGETATQMSMATTSGFSAFSPAYGAPEQFLTKRFGATGPWTDVHALGLILAELVSGKRALDGEEAIEFYESCTSKIRPTPRARGASVSDAFEALCAKALGLNPRERFRDAGELGRALDSLAGGRATPSISGPAEVSERAVSAVPLSVVMPAENALPANQGNRADAHRESGQDRTSLPTSQTVVGTPVRVPVRLRETSTKKSVRTLYVVLGGVCLAAAGVVAVVALSGGPSSTKSSASGASVSNPPSASSAMPAASSSLVSAPAPACPPGMVEIPGGTFQMGSDDEPDHNPLHGESVASFCLDRTEVTVEAYKACATGTENQCSTEHLGEESNGHNNELTISLFCNYQHADRARHPINCVSWTQAEAFCRLRGARLPTEEEWEYAARGGAEGRRFPWGNTSPTNQLCWSAPGDFDSRKTTCEVGAFASGDSRWGVADMAGNVAEWTASRNCYYGDKSCANNRRIVRGGGVEQEQTIFVAAVYRLDADPSRRLHGKGFRCAR